MPSKEVISIDNTITIGNTFTIELTDDHKHILFSELAYKSNPSCLYISVEDWEYVKSFIDKITHTK